MAKSKKAKRIKVKDYQSDDKLEIKQFLITLGVLIVIVLGVYFFTRIFVTKDLFQNEEEKPTAGAINYSLTSIGSMLSKVDEEYYVMVFNSEDLNAAYYSAIASRYQQNKEPLPIYLADLNNELNKKYYDKENQNLNAKDLSDLRVGDITLFKIKKGKITKTINTEEELTKELAYVKDTTK